MPLYSPEHYLTISTHFRSAEVTVVALDLFTGFFECITADGRKILLHPRDLMIPKVITTAQDLLESGLLLTPTRDLKELR
jgi:hypothetical protein